MCPCLNVQVDVEAATEEKITALIAAAGEGYTKVGASEERGYRELVMTK